MTQTLHNSKTSDMRIPTDHNHLYKVERLAKQYMFYINYLSWIIYYEETAKQKYRHCQKKKMDLANTC